MTKCEETPEKAKLSFVKEEEEETCERQKNDVLSLGLIKCAVSEDKDQESPKLSNKFDSSLDDVVSEGRDKVESQLRLPISSFNL